MKHSVIAGSEAVYDGPQALSQSAKLSVIEVAVTALGKLAIEGPKHYLNLNERHELNQKLFECLEILNNEKGHGSE